MSALEELVKRLSVLPQDKMQEIVAETDAALGDRKWIPNLGPQTEAYFSKADVLLYGGQAGGGKTHLELGWAINEADSGIIFRREVTQTDGLEKEGKKIIGSDARFNGQDLEWTWSTGKTLKLAGMKDAGDWVKHAGRERDYFAFDEAGEFLELQVSQIIAWLRAPAGKRTRVVLGSNPPRSADGLWLLKWFAPWIDDKYHERALPGELRWAIHVTEGEEIKVVWVDGPGVHKLDNEEYTAKSYTFIPASLEDNPYRNTPEYKAQLQSLPEPLRSQLLYGKFTAGLKDSENQCIPTEWVRLSMARWTPRPPAGIPMCALAADASGGGDDPMIIAKRYDSWFDEMVEVLGKEIPVDRLGAFCAGVIISHRRDDADITIDMGGGYGGSTYEHLISNKLEVYAYKGAEATIKRTSDKKLGFTNVRSAAYWGLREALDPSQPGGSDMALPPDQRLMADLTAPTFEITPKGIKLESKVDVCKRLGRSTDRGDAVVMCWFRGARHKQNALEWIDRKSFSRPKVVMGRRK